MSNFGAYDLSSLNQKPATGAKVSGFLVKADEALLRQYLQLSETMPILMLVTGNDQASLTMRPLVQKAIESAQGRLAGVEVDLGTSPQLAQALGVNETPSLLAILAGQPAPIFQGEISKEQLLQALSQVLQLAIQNNLTGTVSVVPSDAAVAEKPLSPEHIAALEAIESGEMDLAKTRYEKILAEYPNDQDARAGLYQVELLMRLQSPRTEGEIPELLALADKKLVEGDFAGAFREILDRFALDFENRDLLKNRLLELFVLAGQNEPSVLEARRRLASLLF